MSTTPNGTQIIARKALTMVGFILGYLIIGYLVTYWIYVGSPLAKATANNVIETFLSLFKFVMLS